MPAVTRRYSLRLELLTVLAIILMMAVVSLSLAGQVLSASQRQATHRQLLHMHAQGLTAVLAARTHARGVPDSQTIDAVLRPSLGVLGIAAILLFQAQDDEPILVKEIGLAPALPPPHSATEIQSRAMGDLWVLDHPVLGFSGSKRSGKLLLRLVTHPPAIVAAEDWPRLLLLALGVGALLLFVGAALLESLVLRPLHGLREAVGKVSAGELSTAIPEEGPKEVQGLATAFNEMTASLRARVREIEVQQGRLVRSEHLASVGRVAAGIAHEVGNPLAAILGYVDLLLDPRNQPPLPAEPRELLERSRMQLERIRALVRQLLEYSRPSTGHRVASDATPAFRAIELRSATLQLVGLLRHDPRCEGVAFTCHGDAVQAQVEPAWLDQVLQNLLVNAATASRTSTSPCVEISLHSAGDAVTIEIQDSGPGVDPQGRPHLFEPFFTTARAGEGTGLGLAICQSLVERMGGTLVCLPDGARPPLPGQDAPGAVFRVALPARDNLSPPADV